MLFQSITSRFWIPTHTCQIQIMCTCTKTIFDQQLRPIPEKAAGMEGLYSCAYNHENVLAGNKPQLSLRNKNAQ